MLGQQEIGFGLVNQKNPYEQMLIWNQIDFLMQDPLSDAYPYVQVIDLPVHLHLSLHRPLGVKFARDLHLIMAINCVTYNCRGWNSGSVTISDFID